MFGFILAIFILVFGIFLNLTKDPKLKSSKKFSLDVYRPEFTRFDREINYNVS